MLEVMLTGARRTLGALGVCLVLAVGTTVFVTDAAFAQTEGRTVSPADPTAGTVPGGALGTASDSEIWRAVRRGMQGNVSIPDKQAGVMIQSEGENWRVIRNGPMTVLGAWVVLGFIGVIALFFAIRGRIRIEAGPSGQTIERFNGLERFVHWLTAGSFIVLALTGLNLLYGRHLLLPILGPEVFAALAMAGKYAHNYLSFPFMLGLILMFILWVRHNLLDKYDMVWIAQGGGLLSKKLHPPSRKFNFGQKVIFWVVILGGASLSMTGLALLFPFSFSFWDGTFAFLNLIGLNLPSGLTAMDEMQLSQLWHAFVALIMIGVIIAHIYIGSLGMEGAFAAMGSGEVDENWAREHHSVWVAESKGEPLPNLEDSQSGKTHPAE